MSKKCQKCQQEFESKVEIEGKIRNLQNRRFCLQCSPFGKHNTVDLSTDNKEKNQHCKECNRYFQVDRAKGHRRKICNSCCVMKAQRRKKQIAIDEYGGKCIKCGYNKCIDALEFHHREGKEESPAYIICRWSLERAKIELDKCDLLCSNCHREEHARLNVEKRIKQN